MEDITDANYAHAKRVCKGSEIKNLGEYHDLSVQSDTLLLADVFENFRICVLKYKKINIKLYLQNIYSFFFTSWISMASSFKKGKSKIRSFK